MSSGALLAATPWARAASGARTAGGLRAGTGPYGPLQPPDANGIRLPVGFRSRILALAGERLPGPGYRWHVAPDGGATFRSRGGGWIYVSNSERSAGRGGVGAMRFDRNGALVEAYSICTGTSRNCAGGATPWGTWLSCEETPAGRVFECDPEGVLPPRVLPALGTFQHEAAAVDPETGIVYLTEDRSDGRFYRFLSNAWGDLGSGRLQVARVTAGEVFWHDVPDPERRSGVAVRHQVPESTPFRGGEGIALVRGRVYFTTKGDDRVWEYHVGRRRLSVLYAPGAAPRLPLRGVDNLTTTRRGDLLVAEDGGDMELVMITRDLEVAPVLRVERQPGSELAGPAFAPRGDRLYVSSQRGGLFGTGITYEIEGPFQRGRGPARGRA